MEGCGGKFMVSLLMEGYGEKFMESLLMEETNIWMTPATMHTGFIVIADHIPSRKQTAKNQ